MLLFLLSVDLVLVLTRYSSTAFYWALESSCFCLCSSPQSEVSRGGGMGGKRLKYRDLVAKLRTQLKPRHARVVPEKPNAEFVLGV